MAGNLVAPTFIPRRSSSSPVSSPPESAASASSPLSVLSQSPTLSRRSLSPPTSMGVSSRYPSPNSTAPPSGNASPHKRHAPENEALPGEGPPPPKRRRVAGPPKPRSTEYVDLEDLNERGDGQLKRLLHALHKKRRIVVIAGAGISVSAGIPDFRSPTGLFKTLAAGKQSTVASGKQLFDAAVYRDDSSTEKFHHMVREMAAMTEKAEPTPFHHMLASLAREGRLLRLYTQNVDCIENKIDLLRTTVPLGAKGPWPRTIQLHGSLEKMVCSKCSTVSDFDGELFQGGEPPLCPSCQEMDELRTSFGGKRSHGIGKLRPRIVLYTEYNPDGDAIGNVSEADLRRVPDAVIVVGTSLKVPGVRRLARELCKVTRSRRDGLTAWINLDPEPQQADMKDCWDLVIHGKCDDIAGLANLTPWNAVDVGDSESYMVTLEAEAIYHEKLDRGRIGVLLNSKVDLHPDISPATTGDEQETKTVPATPTNGKSKLAKLGVQERGILTPRPSPKPRNPLPSARPVAAANGPANKRQTLFSLQPPRREGVSRDIRHTAGLAVSKSSSGPVPDKKSAPAPAPKKLGKLPKQSKKTKTEQPPKNTINRVFKATKATPSVSTAGKMKNLPPLLTGLAAIKQERSVSTTNSVQRPKKNASSSMLPSLRPATTPPLQKGPPAAENMPPSSRRAKSSSPLSSASSTPETKYTRGLRPMDTISPTSKPRAMGNLID